MSQSNTSDPAGSGKPTNGGGLGSIDDVQGHPGAGNPPGPAIKPTGKEPPQPGSDPTRTVQPPPQQDTDENSGEQPN